MAERMRALGVGEPLGEKFRCVIPGHDHEAHVHPTRKGFWSWTCGEREWSLAQVRAAVGYGDERHVGKVEQCRWAERLDHEAGLLTPRPVLVPLSEDVALSVRRVAEGWRLLVGLRDPMWGSNPFTFARKFVMAWCGVTDEEARYGVSELRRLGLIAEVGKRRRAILYEPVGVEWWGAP